ncbi:O-acetyl-ADP-ribose deacetylase [Acinetobacter qingfengensis]|uniref:O-acetyl-ADP-ribose deacetylase n=1 Tax=Acinetobacter qingfengensis TaxID=1262585 RepID=A0A1E7RBY2_9GAMM|nr:O-acetyl-ADP-ribose deacetylase [Acinetobacter qingfengensis]KAA8735267.1 O-acetyl-ADP-ribose deacetylase [Acinetobacter qingfengensis]OEY96959.1 O-acetyl-ADP-ribose deacetylase [Acinetobacter qingfengensis]
MVKINVLQADITKMQVDAIVNAANSSLLGGGGVDGAIHYAGGPQILEECQKIRARQGGCRTGEAVITSAGLLNAKYVIHTVGPIWQANQPQQHQLLAQCYRNSLQLAEQYQCHSIAFPNISTGVYHFPKHEAAMIAIGTIKDKLLELHYVQTIYFVCFDEVNYQIYRDRMQRFNDLYSG